MQLAAEETQDAQATAARLEGRDARFVQLTTRYTLRSDTLGADRHHRAYFALPHSPGVVWVADASGQKFGAVETPAALRALRAALLDSGPREKELAGAIDERSAELFGSLADGGSPLTAQGLSLAAMPAHPVPQPPPPLAEPPAAPPAATKGAAPSAAQQASNGALAGGAAPMEVDAAANGAAPADSTATPAGRRVPPGDAAPELQQVSDEQLVAQADRDALAAGCDFVQRLCKTLVATDTGTADCRRVQEQLAAVQDLPQLFQVRCECLEPGDTSTICEQYMTAFNQCCW